MRQRNKEYTICNNLHRIIVYGNGFGFSVFLPGVPQIFKDKAEELIQGLIENYKTKSIGKPEVDAELCISCDRYMENCQYELSAYIYSEGEELQAVTYRIDLGTEYYKKFKSYALQQVNKYLFTEK